MRSLSNDTLCLGVSLPCTEPSEPLVREGNRDRLLGASETESIDTKDPDASKLRRGPREVWSSLPSAGDECIPGSADNLSELVKFEFDDSESKSNIKDKAQQSDRV